METKCLYCGKPFEYKRSTAKYCSNACSQAFHRRRLSPPGEILKPALEPFKDEPHADRLRNVAALSGTAAKLIQEMMAQHGSIVAQAALEAAWYVAFAHHEAIKKAVAEDPRHVRFFREQERSLKHRIAVLESHRVKITEPGQYKAWFKYELERIEEYGGIDKFCDDFSDTASREQWIYELWLRFERLWQENPEAMDG